MPMRCDRKMKSRAGIGKSNEEGRGDLFTRANAPDASLASGRGTRRI